MEVLDSDPLLGSDLLEVTALSVNLRLRKPLERRVYEIARKHCGRQSSWRISLELLQKKCGAVSSLREFRRLLSSIIDEDAAHSHMPDYSIQWESENMVLFRNRGALLPKEPEFPRLQIHLLSETYEAARVLVPNWDVYHVEREWRDWITETPRDPDAAFLGFCRKWQERRGSPR